MTKLSVKRKPLEKPAKKKPTSIAPSTLPAKKLKQEKVSVWRADQKGQPPWYWIGTASEARKERQQSSAWETDTAVTLTRVREPFRSELSEWTARGPHRLTSVGRS